MSKDVFISYSSEDLDVATEVCALVELRGLSCWIASRDVEPGTEWDEAILDAIEGCATFLLVLSRHANASRFVKNEVNRAFSNSKAIFTFRVEDVAPGRSLELYLARHQWADGFPPPVKDKVDRIADAIAALLGKSPVTLESQQAAVAHTKSRTSSSPLTDRADSTDDFALRAGRIGVFRVVDFDRWPYEGVQSIGEADLDMSIELTTNLRRGTKYRFVPSQSFQSIDWGLLGHNINNGIVEDATGNALVSTGVPLPSELWIQVEYRMFQSARRPDDSLISRFRNHLMAKGCVLPPPGGGVQPTEARIGSDNDPHFQWYEMGEPPTGPVTYAFVSSVSNLEYINAHTIPPEEDYQLILASVVDLRNYNQPPSYRDLLTNFARLEQWYLACGGDLGREQAARGGRFAASGSRHSAAALGGAAGDGPHQADG